MKKKLIRLTESDLRRIVKESISNILTEDYRAEFENACDDLYYGYGYDFWRKQHKYLDNVTADRIWNAAFRKMSQDQNADFVPHSEESYDHMMRQNDNRLNVRPDENGRYPDENMNVINDRGEKSMYAQGSAPSYSGERSNKLKGMASIMKPNGRNSRPVMGLDDARDEWEHNAETINRSKNAQRAFRQGRIGNERPLHRRGSLNRAFDE